MDGRTHRKIMLLLHILTMRGSRIPPSGLGGENVTDRPTDERTGGGIHNITIAFFQKCGDNNIIKFSSPFRLLFVCVEVLRPSQLNGVMSSAVSLPNHTFTGQA